MGKSTEWMKKKIDWHFPSNSIHFDSTTKREKNRNGSQAIVINAWRYWLGWYTTHTHTFPSNFHGHFNSVLRCGINQHFKSLHSMMIDVICLFFPSLFVSLPSWLAFQLVNFFLCMFFCLCWKLTFCRLVTFLYCFFFICRKTAKKKLFTSFKC